MRQKKLYTDIKKEQSAEKCEGGGGGEGREHLYMTG